LDKRLLTVLFLCIAIMVGWNLMAERLGLIPPPAKPTATAPGQPGSVPGGPTVGPAQPAPPAVPEKAPISPVVGASEIESLVHTGGERRPPGVDPAEFSNKGAVLRELRTGHHVDAAGRDDVEKSDR
jgi:hypothetical protein